MLWSLAVSHTQNPGKRSSTSGGDHDMPAASNGYKFQGHASSVITNIAVVVVVTAEAHRNTPPTTLQFYNRWCCHCCCWNFATVVVFFLSSWLYTYVSVIWGETLGSNPQDSWVTQCCATLLVTDIQETGVYQSTDDGEEVVKRRWRELLYSEDYNFLFIRWDLYKVGIHFLLSCSCSLRFQAANQGIPF